MKKKLTRNIGLKILSLLFAVILWLVITNVDDPIKTRSFSKQVTILNENLINTPTQAYEITEGETVNFKCAARRSIADTLSASDFNVTADFSDLSNVNSVVINISPKKYGNEIVITDGKYQTLSIKLEELSEKDFKVNIVPKGDVADGYYVGEKSASPNIVRVKGPKGRIDKIDQVVVEVDVSGKSKSFSDLVIPKALDANGKAVDASKLTFINTTYIEVDMILYQTKKVNIQVNTTGDPLTGYVVSNVGFEPKEVTIAANDYTLGKINSIPISVDVTGASQNIEKTINLQDMDVLPAGAVLVGDDQTVVITITVEKIDTSQVTIWPSDINLVNKPSDLKVSINTKGPIIVKARGPSKAIKELTRSNLNPYLDLADCKIGTYALSIKTEPTSNIQIYDTPMISISLTS